MHYTSWGHGRSAVVAVALADGCVPTVHNISTDSVQQEFRFPGRARGRWVLGDWIVKFAVHASM